MKKLLPLLLLVVLLVGCDNEEAENEDSPQSTEELTWSFDYWYEIPLKEVGVAEENYHDCMRWAFGDDCFTSRRSELNDRWNERHPDLFVMYDSDDRDETIYKVGKLYLAQKDEDAETPNDVVWDSNSPLVDSNDHIVIWNNYDTCDYVFDANSDPLIVGKMLLHWLKTNPEEMGNIQFSVPRKDKAEYDAILETGVK